ncbi:DUF7455 domain-containing protein [Arthrobacter sp. IK3]|uniref:DUF7455 domain-containing protein n=1 Tax=Arthrobacter sp. IK3 TaxID=3448169 RepID=UPI003EE2534B
MSTKTASVNHKLSTESLETLRQSIAEAPASPLGPFDQCDRCSKAARASFTFTDSVLLFCGHHMRTNLGSLLAASPAEFWVAAEDLWSVKGIDAPAQDHRRSGDGLTDS